MSYNNQYILTPKLLNYRDLTNRQHYSRVLLIPSFRRIHVTWLNGQRLKLTGNRIDIYRLKLNGTAHFSGSQSTAKKGREDRQTDRQTDNC